MNVWFAVCWQSSQYQTLRECAMDINLIFENARKYNKDESKIYKVHTLCLFDVFLFLLLWRSLCLSLCQFVPPSLSLSLCQSCTLTHSHSHTHTHTHTHTHIHTHTHTLSLSHTHTHTHTLSLSLPLSLSFLSHTFSCLSLSFAHPPHPFSSLQRMLADRLSTIKEMYCLSIDRCCPTSCQLLLQ